MTLRCKVGDLAIITADTYVCSVVEVLAYVGTRLVRHANGEISRAHRLWRVTCPSIGPKGVHTFSSGYHVTDEKLMPIRPGDLQDEEIREAERETT